MLLSLMIATPALADNTSKAYVAVDVGSATYVNSGSYPTSTNIVRLAGGYNIHSAVAVEVGYIKFSDSVYSSSGVNTTLSASAIQFAAVGIYPLTNQFDVTAKLGMSMSTVKDVGGNGTSTWNYSYSKTSILYGIGAQYHMTKHFNVRAQYENFGDMTGTSPALTSSVISVGVAYNF